MRLPRFQTFPTQMVFAMLSSLPLLLLLAIAPIACAQQNNCDLNTITDSTTPIYPSIAKAAHVTGMIIMIASFERSGEVQNVNVVSGPQMLRQPAVDYVRVGWKTNTAAYETARLS